MTCPDCNGSGTYTGLNTVEPCHCQLSLNDSCGTEPPGFQLALDPQKAGHLAWTEIRQGQFIALDDSVPVPVPTRTEGPPEHCYACGASQHHTFNCPAYNVAQLHWEHKRRGIPAYVQLADGTELPAIMPTTPDNRP